MSLEFRHIAHSYGDTPALHDISVVARTGEITCLLGTSGCGKSTLLNLAAGLLPVQSGQIVVDGEIMADERINPPPEQRPVGMMFQDGALFPHMSVQQNIAFGMHKGAAGEVDAWLDQVGLAGLGERYPHELSGGQQQRVALARAMAAEPSILLMDEPFASVDIVLRRSLRRECRALLRERGATVLMVTHDPEEALDIGDRIAVMSAGRIIQSGTPQELFNSPASAQVGAIFHEMQVVAGDVSGEGVQTSFGIWPLETLVGEVPQFGACDLLLRSGRFELFESGADGKGLKLLDTRHQGSSSQLVFVAAGGEELVLSNYAGDDRHSLEIGKSYAVRPHTASVWAFPKQL